VLCIVEAMKLMNEIKAESGSGEENPGGERHPVEFGQTMFLIAPSSDGGVGDGRADAGRTADRTTAEFVNGEIESLLREIGLREHGEFRKYWWQIAAKWR